MKYYTGVGSRACPPDICESFTKVARYLKNWTLRSGGADGADLAFEKGATNKQIFLPWKNFNDNKSPLYTQKPEAFTIAARLHPNWDNLKDPVRKLMARNAHQVLGPDLDSPSLFLVCWTSNGEPKGGTALAINLAQERGIPIFNFFNPENKQKLLTLIKQHEF